MIDYSYKNHFQFGWDNGIYNFNDKPKGSYWVKFGEVKRSPGTFREECVNTARLIANSTKKPILVSYSRGLDSEIIIKSFIEADIPCKALVMEMDYNGKSVVNAHDVAYAYNFLNKNKIEFITYRFNLDDYLRTMIVDEAQKHNTKSIILLIHGHIIKEYMKDYLCIQGGGDIYLIRNRWYNMPDIPGVRIVEHPKSTITIRMADELNVSVVSRFFMYTPELMLSWLLQEDVKIFSKYEESFPGMSNRDLKPFIFHKLWNDLIPRPKYTGFEYVDILDIDNKGWEKLNSELGSIVKTVIDKNYREDIVNIQYEDLIKILSPNENFTSIL